MTKNAPRLVLDVMGGDHAPQAMLDGAQQALPELVSMGYELVLIGDEAQVRPYLAKRRFRALAQALENSQVTLIHADQTIDMEDSIRAVRSKPNASINVGCRMAAESWKEKTAPTGFISAGHSGAVMAAALFTLGRIKGFERPAIATKLPSLSPDGFVLIDAGANIECKPEHLRDFALMGAAYAQVGRKAPGLPTVGILSNGEERSKGTELTRAAYEVIEKNAQLKGDQESIGKFVGYAEGKQIFKGGYDVVVTDGFTGNIVLKSAESLAKAIVTMLKNEAKASPLAMAGFMLASGALKQLKRKVDYAETGAAPLLGVAGYVFISHGSSKSKAIKNALLKGAAVMQSRVVEKLEETAKSLQAG